MTARKRNDEGGWNVLAYPEWDDDVITRLDLLAALRELTPTQLHALVLKAEGYTLTGAERDALYRARKHLTKRLFGASGRLGDPTSSSPRASSPEVP